MRRLALWLLLGPIYLWRFVVHALVPGGSDALDMYSVGGAWKPMPQFSILAGYYYIKDKHNEGNHASQFAIGGEYSLSKRTTLYLEGAAVTNSGANMNLSPIYSTMVPSNTNVHAFMAGVRHTF